MPLNLFWESIGWFFLFSIAKSVFLGARFKKMTRERLPEKFGIDEMALPWRNKKDYYTGIIAPHCFFLVYDHYQVGASERLYLQAVLFDSPPLQGLNYK